MVVQQRCSWCEGDDLYVDYHDTEWGVPVFTAHEMFERLVLEGMQAGLSWLTILKKRAHMQTLFFEFDISRLAAAGEAEIQSWLQDPGIIRHRGKLQAMLDNARNTLQREDFAAWLWRFAPAENLIHDQMGSVPSHTQESVAMSKALKKEGYRFVGPTICYAFMQSVGMVNDHVSHCWRHQACADMSRDALAQRA